MDANVFAPLRAIGGNGGNGFALYGGTNGALLHRIGVWAESWQIKAIRVWLTNGNTQTFGNPNGSYKEYTFEPGERMTRLSLWGNGRGTRTGWIEFSTSTGGSFSHGMTEWKRRQEYPIDIGSGICCGVFGRAGSDIDNMGFVFLRPIKSSLLTNVSYPTLGFEQASITPKVLESTTFENDSSTEQTVAFTDEEEVETSSSWSVTAGLEYSYTSKIEAGIPEVATVGAESTWKVSVSGTYSHSTRKLDRKTWNIPVVCPPHSKVKAVASIRQGTLSLPYTGTIEVTLDTGAKFTYPVQGIYEGVSYSSVEITTEELPVQGYELFFDGSRVRFEPTWSRQQAVENLEQTQQSNPKAKVVGWFNGRKIGYELFWDGVRVGYAPSWSRQEAIENLEWNQRSYPDKVVEGWFEGKKLETRLQRMDLAA